MVSGSPKSTKSWSGRVPHVSIPPRSLLVCTPRSYTPAQMDQFDRHVHSPSTSPAASSLLGSRTKRGQDIAHLWTMESKRTLDREEQPVCLRSSIYGGWWQAA